MTCKFQYNKRNAYGLGVFVVVFVLSGCEADNHVDRDARFFDFFSGMQILSERHCNSFCGPSKFFIPLAVQKKYCQAKCPSSTLANLSLDKNQSTTTAKPETTTNQPGSSSTSAAGSQSSTATTPAATTNQPTTSSNVASIQTSTTPVPTTESSTSGAAESSSPSAETSETTEAVSTRTVGKRSAVPTVGGEQISRKRSPRGGLAYTKFGPVMVESAQSGDKTRPRYVEITLSKEDE